MRKTSTPPNINQIRAFGRVFCCQLSNQLSIRILIFTLCEWLILSYRSRKTQSGLSVGDISSGLLPGFLLMLALRFAAPPDINMVVFVCLSLAGLAHACDFYRRYKQQSSH